MELLTLDHLDEIYWPEAEKLYDEAFPLEGRKSDAIIRSMFDRRVSRLHVGINDGQVEAMAITGKVDEGRVLLIDYLAVKGRLRGQGIGGAFMHEIVRWAKDTEKLRGIVIEAECEPGGDNMRRIRFWEKCGFTLTEYVHRYIWVPELYSAMALSFDPANPLPHRGEELFRYITDFHRKAYAGK